MSTGVVTVVGSATVDLLMTGVAELPVGGGDEFEERTLATLPHAPKATIGGNGGNCAYVLGRLGVAARLVSPMGDDLFGRAARGWLDDVGVTLDRIEPHVTSVNVIATTTGGDRASFFFPAEPDTDDLVRLAEDAALAAGDHLHLAGFPHPSPVAVAAWMSLAGDGVTTSLDIGPVLAGFRLEDLEELLPHLTWLMGNEAEIAALAGGTGRSIAATRSRVRGGVVVKRGRSGVAVFTSDDRFDLSAPEVEAATTVGAGDAFDAGFLAALMRGDRPEDAAAFGQQVAAVVLDRGRGVLAAPTMAEMRPTWPDGCERPTMDGSRRTTVDRLPTWARELKEQHPDGAMPTREDPIPPWLAEETRKVPLWYIIRGAEAPRDAHPFRLHEEILRQPDQWQEILDGYWDQVERLADDLLGRGIERIITTGCGSAFFTALHGEAVLPALSGIGTRAIESFELTHYFPDVDAGSTLVVAHSGTGGSIETVQAVQAAAQRGCATLAVTNTEDTPVGRAAERTLTCVTAQTCGPCISVVSTRVLLISMLGVALAERRGSGIDTTSLRAALDAVPTAGRNILAEEDLLRGIATDHAEAASWLLVGSGPNYFSVREGTLKIEEQAILVGKAYRTGDFHHDALSLVAPERVTVAIEAAGAANERVVDAVRAAREGRSPTVAVTWSGQDGADHLAEVADRHLALRPTLPELVVPVPMTIVFQLLGYHLGVERGFNPDTLRTDHEPNARAWLTSFPLGTH